MWQKKKLLKTSNFSFCHNVFNSFFNNFKPSFMEIFFMFLYVSHLLQICCMWERVKYFFMEIHCVTSQWGNIAVIKDNSFSTVLCICSEWVLKHWGKRRNCSRCLTLFNEYTLQWCNHSCLLHICCMWEKVKLWSSVHQIWSVQLV